MRVLHFVLVRRWLPGERGSNEVRKASGKRVRNISAEVKVAFAAARAIPGQSVSAGISKKDRMEGARGATGMACGAVSPLPESVEPPSDARR